MVGRFVLDNPGITTLRDAVRRMGRPRPVVLRTPMGDLLERRIALPLAAERSVGEVLLHDMDRLTPFRADELYWDWTIAGRDWPNRRLHVRLTLLPRTAIAALTARLGDAGVAPSIIETTASDGSARHLVVQHRSLGEDRATRRAVQAIAVACVILAMTLAALPFVRQSLAMTDVERQITALRPQVDEAEALRRRIAGRGSETDAVAAERARVGNAIAALAALTDILPDRTFLSQLSLTQRQIAMTGVSNEAARLIAALSNEPSIRNPSFAAPVIRSAVGGGDVFSIRAELAP